MFEINNKNIILFQMLFFKFQQLDTRMTEVNVAHKNVNCQRPKYRTCTDEHNPSPWKNCLFSVRYVFQFPHNGPIIYLFETTWSER